MDVLRSLVLDYDVFFSLLCVFIVCGFSAMYILGMWIFDPNKESKKKRSLNSIKE